jgi:hypothetical protein
VNYIQKFLEQYKEEEEKEKGEGEVLIDHEVEEVSKKEVLVS